MSFELLLACVPARPDVGAIRACAERVADWDAAAALAARHAMGPLVYCCLVEACADLVPERVLGELRAEAQACARQSLRYTGELFRVLDAFGRRGIEPIPFKGPVLAWPLYASPGLRQMGDLDLLVGPGEVSAAKAVLCELGYRPGTEADPSKFLRANPELQFVSGDGLAVDLHWHVGPRWFQRWFDAAAMIGRAVSVSVAGRMVPTFCAEDMLRYLCMHAAKHGWFSLRDVCDLARLLAGGVDVERAVADAGAYGGVRLLLAGLEIARQLGGAVLGPEVRRRIDGDAGARRLVRASLQNMESATGALDTIAGVKWQWRLLEQPVDRALLSWGLMQPNCMDRDWVNLPDLLFPAYYVLKPFRLASKYLLR